jgi:hypothetical protein
MDELLIQAGVERKEGELRILTFRRALIDGKISSRDILGRRYMGRKSWSMLLDMLELTENTVSVTEGSR